MAQRNSGKSNLKDMTSKGKQARRAKTVASIKIKVESGRYRVQPKKVADKMVEDAIRSIRSGGR
ncbi:MAG: flagellar biosynthesis anti-sigma factor FlgM [Gemmatimonadota bacterium]